MEDQEVTETDRLHRCQENAEDEGDGIVRERSSRPSFLMMIMKKPTIWCLLVTEMAERFAFYGFRALLVLYLVQELNYPESSAVAIYSYSNSLAYLTPILGACLADSSWGRYSVIARLGTLYWIGLTILTIAAATTREQPNRWWWSWKQSGSFVGLFLVCLGTGGIKPCVSAFGADQVETDAPEDIRTFFSYFYFCINIGALTSTAIVPMVQATYGFGVAFGVASWFMAVALLLFVSQKRAYRYVNSTEGGNVLDAFRMAGKLLYDGGTVYETIPGQQSQEISVRNEGLLRRDVAKTMQIFPILTMLPVYWSLYDQQGSVWTLQATRMDLPFGLQPAQLNVVNPLQILLFIPLFDQVVYPFLERKGINISPLNRMSWGMGLTALAFLVSGVVESIIQNREASGGPRLNVFFQLPQITMLSIGEIFLSITGLEYAYASSPDRLKTFVTALYLATSGLGNALSGLLFSTVFSNMKNRATTMFLCAALMLVNQRIFICVASSSRRQQQDQEDRFNVEIELKSSLTPIDDNPDH